MTMIFDDEYERIIKRMSRQFLNIGDIFEIQKENATNFGPFYYGYTMTVGPDGKPVVQEYGNVKPGMHPTSDIREPIVDVIADEKEGLIKLVAEMPGVEKTDVKITVQNKLVDISAEHDNKKYHAKVPIQSKIDENSAKAYYRNGILELAFKLIETPTSKGKTVEVE